MNNSSKLHVRIARFITLGAIIFTIVASLVYFFYTKSVEQKIMEKTLTQLFSTIESSAEIASYLDNEELALEVVENLKKNDMVAESTIISFTGMIISTKTPPVHFGQSQSFLLHNPFTPPDQVGKIYLEPNLALMNERIKNAALEHAFILFIHTLVIAILVLILVRRTLTHPIQSIATSLHRTAPGDDNQLACPKGHQNDEIGNLVIDINKLLEATRSTIKQERLLRSRMENLEKHFRLIFERSSAGIFILDNQLHFISVNQAFKDIAGITAKERRADKQNLLLPELFYEPEAVRELLLGVLKTGQQIACDLRLAELINGVDRWLHCLFSIVKNDEGETLIEGLLIDITERTFQMERILFESEHDPLTKLFNRRAGEQLLNIMLTDVQKNHNQLALLLVDLDGFKQVNDDFGHEAGDKVLIEVANRMQKIIRKEDVLIRLGGDEFIISFIPMTKNTEGLDLVINKLLEKISSEIAISNNTNVSVGASIGIALFPQDGKDIETLMVSADKAMYQAKKNGKNCAAYSGNI